MEPSNQFNVIELTSNLNGTQLPPLIYPERMSSEELTQLNELPQRLKAYLDSIVANNPSDIDSGHQACMIHPIMLITSGGTSVPLEKRPVRFIENFSTGQRGAKLAESAFQRGLNVIFLTRDKGVRPQIEGQTERLLTEQFSTVYYYLNAIQIMKHVLPAGSIFVMCAAVSDFIPVELSEHKIQTTKTFNLSLTSSPKMLGVMAAESPTSHLCVSFKLETDKEILEARMTAAIDNYGVDMVIGNMLGDKTWVWVKRKQNKSLTELREDIIGLESKIIDEALKCWKAKFGTDQYNNIRI